jgi:hypothetical protein
MQDLSFADTSNEDSRRERRLFAAVAWGVLMGCLTFAAGPLAWGSANPIIDAMQFALTMLLIPGLLCAAMVGSLFPGAVINALFHFGVSWLLLTLLARFTRNARARQN